MGTITKALDLLNFFAKQKPEIGLTEFVRLVNRDKATVHRHLTELMENGFLEQNPVTRAYRLGPAILRLSGVREATHPLRSVLRPIVEDIARQVGELTHVSLLQGDVLSPALHFDPMTHGTQVAFDGVELEGIGRVSIDDIRQAADMGYKIKLLGVCRMSGRGLEQSMSPCLVPATSPLGQLDGGTNMVVIEGDQVGQIVLRGAGAGEGPTASAVMGDVMDIARGITISTFGKRATDLVPAKPAKATVPAAYYLRMSLMDKPGALARVATLLGNAGVSIDRMRQYGHSEGAAPALFVTHKTTRAALDEAIEAMRQTDVIVSEPVALRIESV